MNPSAAIGTLVEQVSFQAIQRKHLAGITALGLKVRLRKVI